MTKTGQEGFSPFAVGQLPAFEVTGDSLARAADFFTQRQVKRIFILADHFLDKTLILPRIKSAMGADVSLSLYSEFSGEPKLASVQSALDAARRHEAEGVLGIGGGSALDMAKIVKTCLRTGREVADFVMQRNPLPPMEAQVPSVMIPTTAGTGSESSGTNILALENGNKGWVWGAETRPDLALLDPHFSTSLPARLTAWTGMDALIHAFEAATNRYTHKGAQLYAYEAIRLSVAALPDAVTQPDNLSARTDMLLASYYAGCAINLCSTSIAHALSHALARLAPVHHGLATALGFEVTLPFVLAANTAEMRQAARLFGVQDLTELPGQLSRFMDRLGIERALPAAFAAFDADDLMPILLSEEIQPMREACVVYASEADLYRFATRLFEQK